MKRTCAVFLTIVIITALSGKSSGQSQTLNPEVFNSFVYANIHFDLRNVYGSGFDGTGNASGATAHWQNWGLPQEGRRASVIFDPKFYLQQYSDLAAAFGNDYVAALNHFVNWGLPMEGRRGSFEFDVQYYLANNSDLQAQFGIHGYQAAANHFLNQGLPYDGRQGSADFSIRTYLANYPEISAAYGTSYFDAMLHWLRRGKNLGRQGTPIFSTGGDCSDSVAFNPPSSRIFIGFRTDNNPGSGTHADPYDGSTADKFDAILRARSESGVTNQVVCILPGTYRTRGNYDWLIGCGHTTVIDQCGHAPSGPLLGFTVRQGWKVHGAGIDVTTLKLAAFVPGNTRSGFPANTGSGLVVGTFNDAVDNGIMISDMTIDDNYDELHAQASQTGIAGLNLQAIALRSKGGNNTIDHIKVVNAAGEIPVVTNDIRFELFPVNINDTTSNPDPANDPNNLVQYVVMSNFRGGKCSAIVFGNVQGIMQFNAVNGYQIAYGVFGVKNVNITDNFALNGSYGFNDDSLINDHVTLQFNEFIHPLQFGMVIGGGGQYSNFTVTYNNINLNSNNTIGLLLQGNVTNLLFGRNNLLPDTPPNIDAFFPPQNVLAFAANNLNIPNSNTVLQDNMIFSGFIPASLNSTYCAFGNWDETSVQRSDFPNTQNTPCVTPF